MLGLTRQGVFHHLKPMEARGQVSKVGRGRTAQWQRRVGSLFRWPISEGVEEDRLWAEVRSGAPELAELSPAAHEILGYAMTEMLNNAIEHSEGNEVTVAVTTSESGVVIEVADDGVGALSKIRRHWGLASDHEAIAHVAKGQQTTAPEGHTGQGLFFTSKAVDRFVLDSGERSWRVDNLLSDQTVGSGSGIKGTRIVLVLDPGTGRSLREVFDRFSDVEEPGIQRASYIVKLAAGDGEWLSRSEARRLATGLERYEHVTLDFAGVPVVGQGFVDQLFRVWQAEHPATVLEPVNMSDDVEFMVRRGLPSLAGMSPAPTDDTAVPTALRSGWPTPD